MGGWELFVESAGGVRGACSLLLFECRCAVVGAPASPASTPQAKGCPLTPRRKGASGSAVSPTANCYLPRGDPFGNQVGMPVLQKTYLGMLQPTTHVCPKSGDSGRSIPSAADQICDDVPRLTRISPVETSAALLQKAESPHKRSDLKRRRRCDLQPSCWVRAPPDERQNSVADAVAAAQERGGGAAGPRRG